MILTVRGDRVNKQCQGIYLMILSRCSPVVDGLLDGLILLLLLEPSCLSSYSSLAAVSLLTHVSYASMYPPSPSDSNPCYGHVAIV